MNVKSRFIFSFLVFSFVFFLLSSLAIGQANVSRTPGYRSLSPRIAVDSAGNIHVAWNELYSANSGDAFYCKYDKGSDTWETPLNLSNSGGVHSEEFRPVGIDVDNSDRIYVVYTDGTGIKLRIYSGGSWGSAIQVAAGVGASDSVRVSVDSSGNIFVCWWVISQYRVYSRARVGGNWESIRTLSVGQSKFCDIDVGNNAVFCTWTARDPNSGSRYRIGYARRDTSFNASWTPAGWATPPPPVDKKHQTPAVEVNSNDIAHIVYSHFVAAGGIRQVRYTRWTGSGFTSPENVSAQQLLHYPALHERGNNLYCCWQLGAYEDGNSIHYNTRIGGSWTGEGAVPNSDRCTYSDVSTSPNQGDIYFVWDSGSPEEVMCNMGATGPAPPPPPPPPPPTGAPVADFTFFPRSGAPPLLVTFDASSSYDADGSIVSYRWNFGDGATGAGQIVTHTYNRSGLFSITLTVTDNEGKTDSATRSLSLLTTNKLPIAEFSFSPSTGIAPLWITCDGSASSDPDGRIIEYAWDFGDGERAWGQVVKKLYHRAGTFKIRLTVTDNQGASDLKVKTIRVESIQQPLNIRWTTHVDQSLFQTRYVTEVAWDPNPANEQHGIQVARHRIYRKANNQVGSAFQLIGEVAGNIFSYRDTNVGGKDLYSYTVTACDSQGRESPLFAGFISVSPLNSSKESRGLSGKGFSIKKD